MSIIVTDAAEGPQSVRVTNTATGTSEVAERSPEPIREAIKRVGREAP